MTDDNVRAAAAQTKEQRIPWTLASADDFAVVDFEAPITGLDTADCSELADQFQKALDACSVKESAEARVFSMLCAVAGMYFKSEDRNDPFGPMFQGPNGRTAIPADFRDAAGLFSELANKTTNLVLRARLGDVASLVDRRLGKFGLLALSTYSEIVEQIDAEKLKCKFDDIPNSRLRYIRDLLRRALHLGPWPDTGLGEGGIAQSPRTCCKISCADERNAHADGVLSVCRTRCR